MTAGESHGPALLATIEGLPSGLRITTDDLRRVLARRRLGYGRGARQKFEADEVSILAGVRHGVTTGAPVAIRIGNSEWPKWETVMSADPVDPSALLIDAGTGDEREIARNRPLTRPRPGHADLPGMLSYDLSEARPVLERASAPRSRARRPRSTRRGTPGTGGRRAPGLPCHRGRYSARQIRGGADARRRERPVRGLYARP